MIISLPVLGQGIPPTLTIKVAIGTILNVFSYDVIQIYHNERMRILEFSQGGGYRGVNIERVNLSSI